MSDYISREALAAHFRRLANEAQAQFEAFGDEAGTVADTFFDAAADVKNFPAADVVPVRNGRWEGYTHSCFYGCDEDGEPIFRDRTVWYCSNRECRRKAVIKEKFRPNCGAKMDWESGE